jgi:hypothetical protein
MAGAAPVIFWTCEAAKRDASLTTTGERLWRNWTKSFAFGLRQKAGEFAYADCTAAKIASI